MFTKHLDKLPMLGILLLAMVLSVIAPLPTSGQPFDSPLPTPSGEVVGRIGNPPFGRLWPTAIVNSFETHPNQFYPPARPVQA